VTLKYSWREETVNEIHNRSRSKNLSCADLENTSRRERDGHYEQWPPNRTLNPYFWREFGGNNKSDEEISGCQRDKEYAASFRENRQKQNDGRRDRRRDQAITKRSISMRVVLDTNVLVSGLLNPNGPPAAILNLLVNAKLELLYDSRILQEYMEVLHRTKFGFNSDWIEALIDYFKDEGEYISAEPTNQPFRDDDDQAFYEVMTTGEADYLITGNGSHFPKDDRIRNPREFVAEYEKRNEDK